MILVPDFLYALVPKDLAGSTLSYHHDHTFQALASTQIERITAPVPPDRVWAISHLAYVADGGGAQTSDIIEIFEIDADGIVNGILRRDQFGSGVVEVSIADMQYLVRPGGRVRAQFFFSANALTNEVRLSIAGFQIPRGNIQLVG